MQRHGRNDQIQDVNALVHISQRAFPAVITIRTNHPCPHVFTGSCCPTGEVLSVACQIRGRGGGIPLPSMPCASLAHYGGARYSTLLRPHIKRTRNDTNKLGSWTRRSAATVISFLMSGFPGIRDSLVTLIVTLHALAI